ncbi:dienelactone hydrolase family protein [Proteus vulgaris]|uniref:acyl-CoA thioester hydrolase/BAAT C-terminal domain-containing protein n=1 Tax=Proteus vulgaris TaxID=585 RepID=UPI001FFF32DB|nr:acyl-CoA thioester hydrolase/BAAT C-terminal domain-containing protein [Proteus vulgaris]UPK79404.1 dienelactone hydrolase family protein [Proteus vulgaris]
MRTSLLFFLSTFLLPSFTGYAKISTHLLPRKDGSEINYYLDKRAEKNQTLIVLMQGSDCNSIKNNMFIQETFGKWLPDSDVLMVEKYGITAQLPYSQYNDERLNCPISYKRHDNPKQRFEDYEVILNKLSSQYPNIILIGGSEGATMVHLVIAKRNDIKAAIAINGGGRFFLDDVLYNIRHTTPKEHVEDAVKGFQQFADAIKNNQIDDEQFISEHSKIWWQQFFTIDLLKVIKSNQHTPILIIQTLNDTNVNVDSFHQLSQDINQPNVKFIKYDKLDHGFYNEQGERLTSEIIRDIQQWYTLFMK